MDNTFTNTIREQLSGKITVYIDEDTLLSLNRDKNDFRVNNFNDFINRLIKNYTSIYYEGVYKTIPDITKMLIESFPLSDRNEIDKTAKNIAFTRSVNGKQRGTLSGKANFRLNKRVLNTAVEALYAAPASLDISSFFRSMFLSYLSLPVYRRERIIYKEEADKIQSVIDKEEKLLYQHKKNQKSRTLIPYSIDSSISELFNYVVGQFDSDSKRITSIRLANIINIVPVHEKAILRDDFIDCYEIMKKNGVEFSINERSTKKVVLNKEQFDDFNSRYFERPIPIKVEEDDGSYSLYFDCSDFQLTSYFCPFPGFKEADVIHL